MFEGKSLQSRHHAETHGLPIMEIKLSGPYPSYTEFIARWLGTMNETTRNSSFRACVHPNRNFDLALLYEMAERFGFYVDTRGQWPMMVSGLRAAVYTTHRDALNFVAITPITSPVRYL